jgi:hypothetical protein
VSYRGSSIVLLLASVCVLAGCGPSKAERDARNKERLELEEKQRREMEAANKAITDMNKKAFGRKPPPLDLGVPPEMKAAPAPTKTPEP